MSIIKKLSAHEAQKIAAGEVVERPANIIKELIENSIDAGATLITVSVTDGGRQLIKIMDNGCGMVPEDAYMCFEKHATSKISSVDQLESITTFGFRGEALASVASVGKVTLITKTAEHTEAIKLELSDGIVINDEMVSANTGTTLIVTDLFYNIPARKKFLKTKETEWRHIQELFYACALINLNIHFKLINDDKIVLNCPPVTKAINRFAQLFSHTKAAPLVDVQAQDTHGNSMYGVISDHQYGEYNRNTIFFFVNNRWVKNYQLSSALIKGYHNVLQPGKFPIASIALTVDPHEVDINIHPRKEEIKFLHPRTIDQLITSTVKQTLEQNLSSKLNKSISFSPAQVMAQPMRTDRALFTPFNFDTLYNHPVIESTPQAHASLAGTAIAAPAPEHRPSIESIQQNTQAVQLELDTHYTLIGQLQNTYLLLEQSDGLFIIDQHAAHERILYEQFAQRFQELPTIKLLFPIMIKVSAEDMELLKPHLKIFHDNSISIEQFSPDQLVVHATPVHLKDVSLEDLIQQVIGWIREFSTLDHDKFFKTINEKLHAQMACKAAIKAGDILTHEKMEQLLTDLKNTPNRFSCPHGRPTGWLLSSYEIEKKFKRKL